jgi:nitrous oxidase accessory protein NosD
LPLPREYGGKVVTDLTQPALENLGYLLKGERKSGYLFLSYHNVVDDFICVEEGGKAVFYRTSDYAKAFDNNMKIYDNGAGGIYLMD